MDCFIIDNITEGDVEDRLLRILKKNKKYFPIAYNENTHGYDLQIKVGANIYDRQYNYIKNMSGRLYLGVDLCRDILKINASDKLVVVVLEENKLYQIINLRTQL